MYLIPFKKASLVLILSIVVSQFFPMSTVIAKRGGNQKTHVKVMTRNLYLGANIFRVVDAAFIPNPADPTGPPIPNPDPLAVPNAVADVFQIMQETYRV